MSLQVPFSEIPLLGTHSHGLPPGGHPQHLHPFSLEASAGRAWAVAPLGQCAGVSPWVTPVTRPHPGVLNMPGG